jgi:L-lactate dehydrogenase complex protein LldE
LTIALFITCLTESYYPRAGAAVVRVLEHLGHDVVFPAEQTCCGQPMFNNGFHDDARDLAKRMIRVFDGQETVVTPSGSCAAMVREHCAGLFPVGSNWRRDAESLASRTFEFVEFLTHRLQVDLRSLGARWVGDVTYHYSCHLRGIGATDETIRLLDQIEGLTHHPLKRMDQCCGFGGTFALNYPTLSGEMMRDKVGCIERTGAPVVVVNDAGCAMNIGGGLRREGVVCRAISAAEIIAESLGLLPRGGAI